MIAGAALDLVRAHLVDVVEELVLVARRQIEDGVVGRDRVVDRLAEVPLLRRNRRGDIGARQDEARHCRNLRRRRIADDLRQQADDVLEVRRRPQPAVPPRGIGRPRSHREPRLPFLEEAVVHVRTDHVEPGDDHGIEVVVEGIAERRGEQHRAGRTGLVVVVHDLRQPLPVHQLVHVLGLARVRHVEVAIVVVPGVLLVEARAAGAARGRIGVLHVALRDHLHPVRVGVDGDDDHVAQDARGLLVGAAHELIDGLDQLMGADDFRRVQAAVEPDDRLSFFRQCARLRLVDAPGPVQLLRDLLVAIELLEVLRRGDDRREMRPALFGLADLHDLHPGRFLVDLLPVGLELIVGGELIVVADVEAEVLFG